MAKTINTYVADQGEVEVTLSAANVAASAALTTAEAIIIDGAVRAFRRTNSPQRSLVFTKVTGDQDPISTRSGGKQEGELWELVLTDDYYSGAAGEWGTDDLAAVEIFLALDNANQDPGGLKCTPAGGATTNVEITLTNPKLLGVGVPEINADATNPAEVIVYFGADGHTEAAHG
jgi:hypothetical protein